MPPAHAAGGAPPSSPSPPVDRSPAEMMSSIFSTRFAASAAEGDRLLFRVSRLDDAGLGRVLDFAGEDVQSGLGVAGLVGRAEVDEQVDGVEPGVLGEHAGISSSESANASTASCSRPETVSA